MYHMHKMLSLLVTMVIQYPFFICRTPQNQTQYICSMYWLLLIESKYWYLLEFQKDTLNMGTYYLRNLCHQLKNKPSWRRSWFLLLLHLWSRTFSSFLNLWTKFIPNIFHISTAIKQELTQCRWVHNFNKMQTLIIKSKELWFKWNRTKIKPKLKQKLSMILSCSK